VLDGSVGPGDRVTVDSRDGELQFDVETGAASEPEPEKASEPEVAEVR
jgi:hypothetical protein